MTKTKWVPQIGDEYYSIDSINAWTYRGDKVDIRNITDGNYFQTPELRQQAIEMLKNAFHGYTLKKPALFPENELPFLNWFDDVQIFKLEFIDKENNLMVFANVTIYVDAEHDGDDWNIPRTTTIKSKLHSLEVDICDENGDEVEDENDLMYNEVLTFLKDFYEK